MKRRSTPQGAWAMPLIGRTCRSRIELCFPIATIALPEPLIGRPANVWEVFGRRRSTRVFSPAQSLPLDSLSSLLWSTQGITAIEGEWYFRAAPSAGALYPIETYILARAVEGLEQGIYHFRPHMFDLEFIKAG